METYWWTSFPKGLKGCRQAESYDQPRQHIKKQRHYFANKGPSNLVKAMVFLWSCMDVRDGL